MEEKKIILVEDDPDHADLITEVLGEEVIGKDITLVRDGMEAIDYFQELSVKWNGQIEYRIKLIILDLNLPKVDGMNVLKFLKKDSKYSKIPVIILSTSSDQETILEAYRNGANSYITKPLSYDEFVDKIMMLKRYLSDTNTLPLQI
jgi:DNA-binding response OmpR family regulator